MATVLFVCVQNAGRSQMSRSLFERAAGTLHDALSAGTSPAAHVHPVVVDVMREVGIELEGVEPRRLTPALAQRADVVVTMGCGDACPAVPGARVVEWDLPDPSAMLLREARLLRDEIDARVRTLLAEL